MARDLDGLAVERDLRIQIGRLLHFETEEALITATWNAASFGPAVAGWLRLQHVRWRARQGQS